VAIGRHLWEDERNESAPVEPELIMRNVSRLAGILLLASAPPLADRGEGDPSAGGKSPVALTVGGEVAKPLRLTAEDLAKLPRQTVRARDSQNVESAFEGVPLVEILKAAGVKFGPDLRGNDLALYLVVEASDGYRAVFSLPEIDPAYADRLIIVADRRDGQPLAPREGPLRVIVPGEKRFSRWIRQVVALKVGRA
jgi:DMSO/TMAO reductase YedYZ molybdopterin-dependent catalytic subunit